MLPFSDKAQKVPRPMKSAAEVSLGLQSVLRNEPRASSPSTNWQNPRVFTIYCSRRWSLQLSALVENNDTRCGEADLNDEAVGRLIQQEYGGLVALLHRKLRDDELVAQVLSEAIATTGDDIRSGRIANPANIAGHVFRRVLNELRSQKPETLTGQALDRLLSHRAQPATAAEIDMQGEVRRMLLGIFKPKDREIVRRFYLDEVHKDAICRDLGLLPLRFDQVLMRTRQRVRALLTLPPRAHQDAST